MASIPPWTSTAQTKKRCTRGGAVECAAALRVGLGTSRRSSLSLCCSLWCQSPSCLEATSPTPCRSSGTRYLWESTRSHSSETSTRSVLRRSTASPSNSWPQGYPWSPCASSRFLSSSKPSTDYCTRTSARLTLTSCSGSLSSGWCSTSPPSSPTTTGAWTPPTPRPPTPPVPPTSKRTRRRRFALRTASKWTLGGKWRGSTCVAPSCTWPATRCGPLPRSSKAF
mmetsp:Transcript_7630/g.14894  ORF Transcript_7630/g.14894 Transcript_7630/m.14894 type:complete len:225 (-) Transcript_7630:761-1435(-)